MVEEFNCECGDKDCIYSVKVGNGGPTVGVWVGRRDGDGIQVYLTPQTARNLATALGPLADGAETVRKGLEIEA